MLKVDLHKAFDSVRWDFVLGRRTPYLHICLCWLWRSSPRFYALVNIYLMFAIGVLWWYFIELVRLLTTSLRGRGLILLLTKRKMTFLCGTELNQQETYDIRCYDFPAGSFLIRYLGLPLMHQKLRVSKYSLLLDKISKRFQIWSARSLSFVWCLQLVSYVISCTAVLNHYIQPTKRMHKKIWGSLSSLSLAR